MTTPASIEQVWSWLGEVPDPEIPAISVVDLGIVRDVAFEGPELVVTVTPTYSGCPANTAIAFAIEAALHAHGLDRIRLRNRLAPAWTTDRTASLPCSPARSLRVTFFFAPAACGPRFQVTVRLPGS